MRTEALESGQNADRITRLFARFISVGYLVYPGILAPSISMMATRTDTWWTPVALAMVFGSGVLPGALSFHASAQTIRRVAGAAAVLFLIAAALWPMAWTGPALSTQDSVWLSAFPGLASLAAAIAWPAALTCAHLVAACVSVQVINFVARGATQPALLVPETLFSIVFCTLFVGGAMMALRTGRLLDTSKEKAHAAAAAAAAERARVVERERFNALTHDNVMTTLLAASRTQASQDIRSTAAATLGQLDQIRSGAGSDEPFSLNDALSHWRAAAASADDRTEFEVARVGSLDSISADGTRALGAALAEAVRNSRVHAGDAISPSVTVTVQDSEIGIDVVDDGAGFDPASVAPQRLGIAVSILTRMSLVPGGYADVDSRPGAGTQVRLGWSQS